MEDQQIAGVKKSPTVRRGGDRAASAQTSAYADPMLASMQPQELRLAMDDLGYGTQMALARAIGVDRSTVSLWLEGRIGVPRPIAKLLRLLVLQEEQAKQATH